MSDQQDKHTRIRNSQRPVPVANLGGGGSSLQSRQNDDGHT